MPLEKKIQLSKSNCFESIYFVLKTLSSKNISRIQFKILNKLLGTAISCLTKLALISGVSLAVFTGSELSATSSANEILYPL
jgi:formate-dependent nitrite reductase membrane component NrfD